jgi:hypothetical protein
MLVKRIDRSSMVGLLEQLSAPGQTEQESETCLLTFCLNCPDPYGAMSKVLDAPRGTTDAQIVEESLAMPNRSVACVPASELPVSHPLRTWRVEE